MKHIKNVIFIFLLLTTSTYAQVGIGTPLEASAQLEVTNTAKGFLPPRMSEIQRDAITDPAAGLMIYNTTSKTIDYFDGAQWEPLDGSYSSVVPHNTIVMICDQVWMAENLNVSTYRDGTPIPEVQDYTEWANLTTGAWCYYNNDPANGAIYGKLYNWYAVAGIHDNNPNTPNKELTPLGWHVPSGSEWNAIENCLGNSLVAGGSMKESGTTHWASPNVDATNSSGFTGLPGGSRGSYLGAIEGFHSINTNAGWWSTQRYSNGTASFVESLNSGSTTCNSGGRANSNGISIRCVRD